MAQYLCTVEPVSWDRESLTKTHKCHHLSGTVLTKACLFSLSWKTTCLERPPNLVVALYRFHCIWVRAYWFSVTSFSKWLPGGHIRFFGFWMAWFRQRNSSLLWNFSFKFYVHVLCGCRQKPKDCQLCRFQNGCLVILNNVPLQSSHCPLPTSPMERGYPSRSLIYNF